MEFYEGDRKIGQSVWCGALDDVIELMKERMAAHGADHGKLIDLDNGDRLVWEGDRA